MSRRSQAEQFSVQLIHEQASRLARLYSNYQSWLPSPGREEHLELLFGTKLLGLFKWIDSHPEAQKLLQDYHQRELQHDQMSTIDNAGPFIPYQDPANDARLFLDTIDAMRSNFLGAIFGGLAQWNGYDLAGQLRAAEMGANLGELFFAAAETKIDKAENEEHVKMADPGPGEKLYAKGEPKEIDPKSFEPLGQGLPGYRTYQNEKEESEDSEKTDEHRESEDKRSERIEKPSSEKREEAPTSPQQEPNYSTRDGREIYVPSNGESNYTPPDGKPVQVPANQELNYTPPEAPQVPAPTEGQPLSTPNDGGQNLTHVSVTTAELQQGPQKVEGMPSSQPDRKLNVWEAEAALAHVGLGPREDSRNDATSNNNKGENLNATDAHGYDSGRSNASGYDSRNSIASGYDDGGYSDAGGYGGGHSDTNEASEDADA